MKVMITGAQGQLGQMLLACAPSEIKLMAMRHVDLDITDATAVQDTVRAYCPDWIINVAAYTAVDRAEREHARAFAINADGARYLADAALVQGARLVQISTDFVFDGQSGRPYKPDDPPAPLGVYGASKLAGENAVRERLEDDALIVRTAWLYSSEGRNFMLTMLHLMRERDRVEVVADQVGTPTSAYGLAGALWEMVTAGLSGTYHWTDAGVASWYDFAIAIRDEALSLGLLEHPVPISPLTSVEYQTPARRPSYSVLDKSTTWDVLGHDAPHWREALWNVLAQIGVSSV